VIVVGNARLRRSITRGVLSGMKRDISIGDIDYKNLLQTDARSSSNSGGPLVIFPHGSSA
jgi:S1-C subfamily serine protease